MAAHRLGRARVRALAAALATARPPAPRGPRHAAGLGCRARGDELLLLRRDRPASARHRGGDRVPAGDRAGRAGVADAAQRRGAGARRDRRLPGHRRPARGRRAGLRPGLRERRAVRGLHRPEPPRGAGRGGRRRPGRVDGRGGSGGDPGGRRRRAAGAVRSGGAGGRHRGRPVVLGHPLRHRPAGDGQAVAGGLRADGLAAAGHRDGDRGGGPGAGAHARRGNRRGAGRLRRRPATGSAASLAPDPPIARISLALGSHSSDLPVRGAAVRELGLPLPPQSHAAPPGRAAAQTMALRGRLRARPDAVRRRGARGAAAPALVGGRPARRQPAPAHHPRARRRGPGPRAGVGRVAGRCACR